MTMLFIIFFIFNIHFVTHLAHALGSGSTISVSYASFTVCSIAASQRTQNIQCYRPGFRGSVQVQPNVSFSTISGGASVFCGIRNGGYSLLCWDSFGSRFPPKRLYYNNSIFLNSLSIGDDQICATTTAGVVTCWRGGGVDGYRPVGFTRFASISSGFGFSCGVVNVSGLIRCWGGNPIANRIESEFGNMSMFNIQLGGSHACGLNATGVLVCKGDNSYGQLNIGAQARIDYTELALGGNHTCAIMRMNGSVVCWGGNGDYNVNSTNGVSFEKIVSGSDFVCGLTTANLSILCWGPGWTGRSQLPLPQTLPGPCVRSSCSNCGVFPQSQQLCSGSGNICNPCAFNVSLRNLFPPPTLAPSPLPSRPSKVLRRGLLAFAIVGSVGAFSGICTVIYCLYTGVCFGNKKVYNSVQPTITRAPSNGATTSNNSPISRSSTIRRQGSRAIRRQRSGTSSKHGERAEEFTLQELSTATDNFSLENKIGAGSFGTVYRGKLTDGREVAIKRGETGQKLKKFQEKESAFDSELAFLSRLHHKHLVRLVGYCEERDERLLVYDYMKNGALYDHLHDKKNNVEKSSSVVNTWKVRIKIALDAARGIEYLHNYAVPPIIHRDIKSSNILLDSNWTARVSDFGLSLMGPESSERDYMPSKAAGTVGYIDPEYYGLNVLTTKSDVYGLGIVLLELLTGRRAIFRDGENGGGMPISLVDYAVPAIMAGEVGRILDSRVGMQAENAGEAVELVAYTAMHCVNLEGKDRPTMSDIVANLERALSLCDHNSHGSISSGTLSILSE